jgi:hypothetical protein
MDPSNLITHHWPVAGPKPDLCADQKSKNLPLINTDDTDQEDCQIARIAKIAGELPDAAILKEGVQGSFGTLSTPCVVSSGSG